jgi:hypothetical protein
MHMLLQRLRDESAEGVISTGIAILIMAVIGAAMFAVFNSMMSDAGDDVQQNLDEITSG